MKVPHTIPKCACKAFKPSKACLGHASEPNRILKAEQVTWDELLPKTLSELATDALIKNFTEKPIFHEILLEEDKNVLLENLPLDLPLKTVIPIIPDGIYWQRRALERWPSPADGTCDITQHNNSWRELYLERDIQEWIENLVPGDEKELGVMGVEGWGAWQRNQWVDDTYVVAIDRESDFSEDGADHTEESGEKEDMFGPEEDIDGGKKVFENGADYKDMFPEQGEEDEDEEEEEEEEDEEFEEEDSDASPLKKSVDKPEDEPKTLEKVSWAAQYIHCLRLRQLLVGHPPTPPPEGSLHDCTANPAPNDHIDLGPILCRIGNLWELSIVYEVRNLGIDFAWNYFTFSMADSINLARGLLYCSQLKTFRLQRSDLDDARLIVLLQSLITGVNQLEILDLSHNHISNDGAIALAKLIACHPSLQELKLCNNWIGPLGVEGLSYALARSPMLIHLDLRLNSFIGNEGGKFLCSALTQNTKLETLVLAACGLGREAGKLMGEMIQVNSTLLELDLSNNDLREETGESLHNGLIENYTLQKLDLRMAKVSQEWEFTINELLVRNIAFSIKNHIKNQPQTNLTSAEEN